MTRRDFHGIALRLLGGSLLLGRGSYAQADDLETQPFLAQVKRMLLALTAVGDPLPAKEIAALQIAFANPDNSAAIESVESVLDQHVLLNVQINPESRVSVSRGPAPGVLVEQGWRTFLVKVVNDGGDKGALQIQSPQGRSMGRISGTTIVGAQDFTNGAVDAVEARDRWAEIASWDKPPLDAHLSGLRIEYRVLQIYSRDRGKREATLEATTGHGKQDLGFRSSVGILFDCMPSREVVFRITDTNGSATTASITITDSLNRVYPPQGKRALPDLWFQRQIYRSDGESLRLPAGKYVVEYGRGPEYVIKQLTMTVEPGDSGPIILQLERWVLPSNFGYFSGDTHIHAAGCAHYESPTEGVTPDVMFRQVQGEALDLGDVLTWAPGFFYQRQFFTGHVHSSDSSSEHIQMHHSSVSHPAGATAALLRYDIEVSGFPSSHCGHLVLLRLSDQNYPGTQGPDQWPSWNIPIAKWAKAQGSVVGYAHSANGLAVDSTGLPNYLMPTFESSGANEYLVDVTHEGLIDFISGCDGWPFVELNLWYHTLNCGFRTVFAGETDFPCLTDKCVGGGRSYVKLDSRPVGDQGYEAWIAGVKDGRSYVGDGRSHIIDFDVSSGDTRPSDRTIHLNSDGTIRISAKVCARLEPETSDLTEGIRRASPYDQPFWHLERARLDGRRSVEIELVVNGIAVKKAEVIADGTVRPITFDLTVSKSSWIALRIYPSCHTNPIFVSVSGNPIRVSKESAVWCRKAVDVCWDQKSQRIRSTEMVDAQAAFDHARRTYDRIVAESS